MGPPGTFRGRYSDGQKSSNLFGTPRKHGKAEYLREVLLGPTGHTKATNLLKRALQKGAKANLEKS